VKAAPAKVYPGRRFWFASKRLAARMNYATETDPGFLPDVWRVALVHEAWREPPGPCGDILVPVRIVDPGLDHRGPGEQRQVIPLYNVRE
jgi:hypothetical protein